ncbi:hypothetical protein [Amycolatopsis pittospori]|uniref:hypothetical protein n=1 Tax=Amycolatopsis pittospori TaxID=2749434 RepID=UPI0015F0B57F|nr:hypothetical protein [Amycolatopsis pittospori]
MRALLAGLLLAGLPMAPATSASVPATLTPYVYLAPDEQNKPVDAEQFVQHSALKWSHSAPCPSDHQLAGQGAVSAAGLGGGSYQHQKKGGWPGCKDSGTYYRSNDRVRPHEIGARDGMYLDLDNGRRGVGSTSAPVYYEYEAKNFITYWMFYPYNNGPLVQNHEGDWERVAIRLDANDKPVTVAYFGHGGSCVKPWASAPKSGGHPIVFSARGTHASYPREGDFPTALGFSDHTGKGAVWQTATAYDARTRPWFRFGGAWGEVGESTHTTGPGGPGAKNPAPDWAAPACA